MALNAGKTKRDIYSEEKTREIDEDFCFLVEMSTIRLCYKFVPKYIYRRLFILLSRTTLSLNIWGVEEVEDYRVMLLNLKVFFVFCDLYLRDTN